MAKSVKQVLIDALALLRSGFTQGAHAVNANGVSVVPWSPNACKWCADGALAKAAGITDWGREVKDGDLYTSAVRYANSAVSELYPSAHSVVRVNDEKGKTATLRVFRRAIRLAPAD